MGTGVLDKRYISLRKLHGLSTLPPVSCNRTKELKQFKWERCLAKDEPKDTLKILQILNIKQPVPFHKTDTRKEERKHIFSCERFARLYRPLLNS